MRYNVVWGGSDVPPTIEEAEDGDYGTWSEAKAHAVAQAISSLERVKAVVASTRAMKKRNVVPLDINPQDQDEPDPEEDVFLLPGDAGEVEIGTGTGADVEVTYTGSDAE